MEGISPASSDLTLLGTGLLDGSTVLRFGTRQPWTAADRLLLLGGERRLLLYGEAVVVDEQLKHGIWTTVARQHVELRRAKGASVQELVLPAGWDWWMNALADNASLKMTTIDSAGRELDKLDQPMRDGSRTDHHVAFVHHGNQGLTWTDVLWGHEANSHEQHWADYLDTGSSHNGFDEILGLHDLLDVPANFQVSGTLQSAAAWYYPDGSVEGWNEWLARGVTEGWAALLASAYSQHIMPFVQDSMNDWSVHKHASMTEWRYGYTPHVAWVPERVWVSPEDNDGNAWDTSDHVIDWIGDDWLPHGIHAVLLDQEEHCEYENNWSNDRHIYTIPIPDQGDLKIIPINGSFTGACHNDAGDAWNQVIGLSADELLVYGTDWEVVAEVAGFEDQFPSALNNMIWLVQQIAAASGSVESVKLDEVIGGFGGGAITLQNGTYGLLGGRGGYGSDWLSPGTRNSWYGHWASTLVPSDQHDPQWNYGFTWDQTWAHLMNGPDNSMSELAWTVMMTNLYETGWHDDGEVSGWIHRYASHIKNARVYSEAARWGNGTAWLDLGAQFSDIDADGVDELVLWSPELMAVFESNGGRAPWIFARDDSSAVSLVGSCNTYWVETEGDYNDGSSNNHVAAFSDVSPQQEHDPYAMSIDSSGADFAKVRLEHPGGLVKTVSLATGDRHLTVDYDAPGEVYIRHGFTPDYLDLLYNAATERLWDPDANWPQSDWMGQRNSTTGWTAALVLGNGGAEHGSEFQGTLVRGDEIRGQGRFRYLLYGGPANAPDGSGVVAELESLAQLDLDSTGPRLATTAPFLAPDIAVLDFDEAVDAASAAQVGNYALSGFPAGVSILSAQRQAWWNRVHLQLAGLSSGDTGLITVSGITDLAGNPLDMNHNMASFLVPNGLTPHSILIDGQSDFQPGSEWMNSSSDSLFITWDADHLYIGFHGAALSSGDFFVYFDTDLIAASGAPRNAWDRVAFQSTHRPEYELSIEGGGNSMQINSWDGSWSYVQYGVHGGSSYEGWTGNLLTELKIPWVELGTPEGLAIAASLSAEDSQVTQLAWPESNPTGDNITISDWYLFAQPGLAGPMPLMGVMPNQPNGEGLSAVTDLSIDYLGNSTIRLSWTAVPGAADYAIYQLAAPWADPGAMALQVVTGTELVLPLVGNRASYVVVAQVP